MTDEVPWPFAGRVAGLVAGSYPLGLSYHTEQLRSSLPPIAGRANLLVAESTGLELPGAPEVIVVGRRDWAERNIAAFSKLMEPAEQRIAQRLGSVGADEIGPTVARRLVAGETGALLGVLSRRVLGQYELVLPTGDDGDSVAFVGENILQMERNHQFRPAEFRLWLALHELAHRAQFVGVPWMRDYFQGLVQEMIASAAPEPGRLRRVVAEVRRRRRSGPIVDERGLFGLLASPRQSATLDRIQALMSLLEGHGHVVMDRIGQQVLISQGRMSSILKARRADPKLAAFFRLTGIEMKMRQYERGEQFVLGVERLADWDALAAAWSGPESLPTLAEIEDPGAWLRRVA